MGPHILKLESGWRQVVASPPPPLGLFSERKEDLQHPPRRKLGGPHGAYGSLENRQMFRLCREIEPRFVGRPI